MSEAALKWLESVHLPTPSAKAVLMTLCIRHDAAAGGCIMSRSAVASFADLSLRSANYALADLQERHLVEAVPITEGTRRATTKWVLPLVILDRESTHNGVMQKICTSAKNLHEGKPLITPELIDAPKETDPIRPAPRAAAVRVFDLKELPASWKKYAQDVRPDIDPEKTFRDFSFFWKEGGGKGTKRGNWGRTWQNWVKKCRGTQVARPAPAPQVQESIFQEAARKVREEAARRQTPAPQHAANADVMAAIRARMGK